MYHRPYLTWYDLILFNNLQEIYGSENNHLI